LNILKVLRTKAGFIKNYNEFRGLIKREILKRVIFLKRAPPARIELAHTD
jgi:hypothetical protein